MAVIININLFSKTLNGVQWPEGHYDSGVTRPTVGIF